MVVPTRRAGLTLVETLVAIAILGVLMGLLAAGIQQVRGAALRASCLNSLRQVGLAIHHYHAAHGLLPTGISHPWMTPGNPPIYGPNTDSYPLLNWQGRLLLYIEQDAVWMLVEQAYALDRYFLSDPPHVGFSATIALYICPADGKRWRPGFPAEESPGSTSYLGVSGRNEHARDGLFFLDSRLRFTDVSDGTSQTLMVGERPPTADIRYGRWYGGYGFWGRADAYLGVRETDVSGDAFSQCPRGPYSFTWGRLEDPCSRYHYWSFHSGGANFLFADGSARFLPYSAATIMPALATRAGGEAVTLPD